MQKLSTYLLLSPRRLITARVPVALFWALAAIVELLGFPTSAATLQVPGGLDRASYLLFEKSSTANNWPFRSATPMPIEFMSVSSMFA